MDLTSKSLLNYPELQLSETTSPEEIFFKTNENIINRYTPRTFGPQIFNVKIDKRETNPKELKINHICSLCKKNKNTVYYLKDTSAAYIKECPSCETQYNTFKQTNIQKLYESINKNLVISISGVGTGKTTIYAYIFTRQGMLYSNSFIMVLAPTANMYKAVYSEYLNNIPPKYIKRQEKDRLVLINGSTFQFITIGNSKEKALANFRTYNANGIHIVEANATNFWQEPESGGKSFLDEIFSRLRDERFPSFLKDNYGNDIKKFNKRTFKTDIRYQDKTFPRMVLESNPDASGYTEWAIKRVNEVYMTEEVADKDYIYQMFIDNLNRNYDGTKNALILSTTLDSPIFRHNESYLENILKGGKINYQSHILSSLKYANKTIFPDIHNNIISIKSLNRNYEDLRMIIIGVDPADSDPVGFAIIGLFNNPLELYILETYQSEKQEGSFSMYGEFIIKAFNKYEKFVGIENIKVVFDNSYFKQSVNVYGKRTSPAETFMELYNIRIFPCDKKINNSINFLSNGFKDGTIKILKEFNENTISTLINAQYITNTEINYNNTWKIFGKYIHIIDALRYALMFEDVQTMFDLNSKIILENSNIEKNINNKFKINGVNKPIKKRPNKYLNFRKSNNRRR